MNAGPYHDAPRLRAMLQTVGVPTTAAERLTSRYGSAAAMQGATVGEIAYAGRGRSVARIPRWAAAVRAALDLAAAAACDAYRSSIREPSDAAAVARALWGAEDREHFGVFMLDARQRVIGHRVTAIGSLARVDVHPREVYRPAMRAGCHAIIAVHNHPSGVCEPSDADLELTRRLMDTGRIVGIPLLDHLVVTRTEAVSLASLGLMPG
jgi:DNA repair protein RadC